MLEHQYLPRVANYRFSQQMRENIPKLLENIKEASMSELKDFLENIRKLSPKIGEVAMKHVCLVCFKGFKMCANSALF